MSETTNVPLTAAEAKLASNALYALGDQLVELGNHDDRKFAAIRDLIVKFDRAEKAARVEAEIAAGQRWARTVEAGWSSQPGISPTDPEFWERRS